MSGYSDEDLEWMRYYWRGPANARGKHAGRFDEKLIRYFFWKWEYDRRNPQYRADYLDGVVTRSREISPAHFFKTYKHVHLDPEIGFDAETILRMAFLASDDMLPPEQFINDGREEDAGDKFPEVTIDQSGTVRYAMDLSLPVSRHKEFLDTHYARIKEAVAAWTGSRTTVIFNDALGSVFIPEGKRRVDDTRRRALGLFLYDNTDTLKLVAREDLKGPKKLKGVERSPIFDEIAENYDETKRSLFLRRTRACVEAHEVLPFKE